MDRGMGKWVLRNIFPNTLKPQHPPQRARSDHPKTQNPTHQWKIPILN
jgi:hypothetical protein